MRAFSSAVAQYDLDQIRVLRVMKACRTKLRNSPKSAEDYVMTLEQQGLPQTCRILRQAIDLI
jgi:hypothetical protein